MTGNFKQYLQRLIADLYSDACEETAAPQFSRNGDDHAPFLKPLRPPVRSLSHYRVRGSRQRLKRHVSHSASPQQLK